MFSQKNRQGFSILQILIILIVLFVIFNILFSIYSAVRPIIWPGYGYYYGGHYYGYKNYGRRYPTYPSGGRNSKFKDRFSSKRRASSFASRFSSKYGRSRVSGFRSSGFFGGK